MEGGHDARPEQPRVTITGWHAHVYFDADEADAARIFCETARDALGVRMGRVHSAPVGPHPRGSCQLTIPPELFAAAIGWLVLNRGRFTVFVHAETGDDLADHSRHVLWLGASEPLDLSIFG